MAHYKGTIEYDGTEFYGFQRQRTGRTVQGVFEEVLSTLNGGLALPIRAAGRTDSGVHATGQVINFHLTTRLNKNEIKRALNAMLPKDVAIRDLSNVAPNFHPRYDAISRVYIYTILNRPIRQPLKNRTSFHVRHPLNEKAMNDAVQRLLGKHDFASFGRATSSGGPTIRVMMRASVWREGDLVRIGVEANGFLYRMVRSIVGTLLVIGRNQKPPDWIEDVLAARNRSEAGTVVQPQGLCLVAVRYPNSSRECLFGAPYCASPRCELGGISWDGSRTAPTRKK